jgi:enolase-phosphatase E1
MKKTLLFDIEGTTTDISFVHKVLFPYSLERIESYVRQHPQHPAIAQVRDTLKNEEGKEADLELVIDTLKKWIREDRKHGALKLLQGDIWEQGYAHGDYQGHVYPDVPVCWKQWKEQGYQLAIYSSGSVKAQKQIFGHSVAGDLTPLLSAYFDTQVGPKREVTSYQNIAAHLKTPIVFFSDIKEELDAAKAAGLETIHVFRQEKLPSPHRSITSFTEYRP